MNGLPIALTNSYVSHKQRLLPGNWAKDAVQTTRDVVALHATSPTGPFLSLRARVPGFQREWLEQALYDQRDLVRVLCMRTTLHVVPSDELSLFFQAYRQAPARPQAEALLVMAGLCTRAKAGSRLEALKRHVLDVLAEKGPSTVREISKAVPELGAKIGHSSDKAYAGEFSLGSRLIPAMCGEGLLVRAQPRGTWRSNLYEYAPLADWLPEVDLASASRSEARSWLVGRYLSAFGPVSLDDIQWWTGFAKGDTKNALAGIGSEVVEVSLEGLEGDYLMLASDFERLEEYEPPDLPYVFFLPLLDPYIMGHRDRDRYLAAKHRAKVFDRAGNAVPTVWINGRVAGVWGQRQDGSLAYRLFKAAGRAEQALLEAEVERLAGFLAGEYLRPLARTSFTRGLGAAQGNPE